MKTEKKSNEPSCIPAPVVKLEDPEPKRKKIKEEVSSSAAVTGNSEEPVNNDNATECLKDPVLDNAITSDSIAVNNNESQNSSTTNQNILNPSVKQETENISSTDLPNDCSANANISGEVVQPLVSNVLTKQMSTSSNSNGGGEAQYMQQQSQIFVFSTHMANKGAEMVLQGQFPTIIAYHCAQPNTKKYLEKHPNKILSYRQNQQHWLNSLSMKHKDHQSNVMNPNFPMEQPPDLPPIDQNASAYWNEQVPNLRNLNGSNPLGNPESSLDDGNIDVPCLVPNSPNNPVNPQSAAISNQNLLIGGPTSPSLSNKNIQPSLQGVKVPDENLTPQQRQHREEQLATIKKMQMMLFPEQKDVLPQLDPTQINMTSQGPNLPPVSVAPNQCIGPNPVDWSKMQHTFLDGKNKMGVGSPGVPLRGAGIASGVSRSQGPPPPYHQTTRSASVPIAIQSPNPSSPNNPTSNLSLPSPRANSALNSPAECNRQFQLGGQRSSGHLPGQSPTSQDSPNPTTSGVSNSNSVNTRLNHSNPGTPVSQALATLSPSGTPQKDSSSEFNTNQPNDGMFCRNMTSLPQLKQQHVPGGVNPTGSAAGVKEPNLMPVPSPQQIQYLSSFDAQELTIQKQPNTSLKDNNNRLPANTQSNNNSTDISGRMIPSTIDNNNHYAPRTEGASPSIESASRGGFVSLHSPHTPHTPHTPGSVAPHTPIDQNKSGNNKSSAQSSPASHNTSLNDSMGPPRTIPASPNTKSETSPLSKELQQQQQQQQQFQQIHQQQNMQGMPAGNPNLLSSMPPFPCNRPTANTVNQTSSENLPLNPNNSMMGRMNNTIGGNVMGPMVPNSFDPITSLAQMSQQLTNTAVNNNPLGGNNENSPIHQGNPSMMSFNNSNNNPPGGGMHMHMQMQQQIPNEMNGCHMGPPQPTNDTTDVSGLCMSNLGGPPTSYSPTPHNSVGSPGLPNKIIPHHHHHHHQHHHHPMMQQPQQPHMMNHTGPYSSGPIPQQGPQHMHPQQQQQQVQQQAQMLGPGNPYNGASVQVKPSAPNTIQYLPARPNIGHAPRGPPSLDFLQRFANPMSGMEAKMAGPPSVNLQYFPNGCMPNNMGPNNTGGGGPVNTGGPGGLGGVPHHPGSTMQGRPMDNNPGLVPGGPMHHHHHHHPTMRPGVLHQQQQANVMRMQQHMVGGGVFSGNPMDSDMMGISQHGPNPGMYGPGPPAGVNKLPSGLSGPPQQPPPDATQPLPASMGGGVNTANVGGNFKSSPFMNAGSSMNDPNYRQQFHNFQQQLYATGTRGANAAANAATGGVNVGGGPPPHHPNMQPNSHQQFYMHK